MEHCITKLIRNLVWKMIQSRGMVRPDVSQTLCNVILIKLKIISTHHIIWSICQYICWKSVWIISEHVKTCLKSRFSLKSQFEIPGTPSSVLKDITNLRNFLRWPYKRKNGIVKKRIISDTVTNVYFLTA